MKAIVIERGMTKALEALPPYSLALDGYVQGPKLDLANHRISVDHHDGCIRLFTSATCRQVLDMLLLGFDPRPYTVYINDVDGDTALSVWLLQNYHRADLLRVRSLVEGVAAMDAHGPAYPVLHEELVRQFYDGAMAPESEARRTKAYNTCDLKQLLEECVGRINKLIEEGVGAFPVKDKRVKSYDVTRCFSSSFIVATSDDYIFDKLYEDGYAAAICYQVLPDGSYLYTIAKKSELVDIPVGPHSKEGTILHALAQRESGWGGSSTIGGAPRNADGSRSRLTPNEVAAIVTGVLSEA